MYNFINSHDDQILLNASLNKIENFCKTWGLVLNTNKSHSITFTRKIKVLNFYYNIDNRYLDKVDSVKYLGVTFTRDFSFNLHIQSVINKSTSKLFFLSRNLKFVEKDIRILAFNTYIKPLLEYAVPIWDPHTALWTDKLQNIQRKAIRFINNNWRWSSSPTEMLREVQWIPLGTQRKIIRLKFLFQIIKGFYHIDSNYFRFRHQSNLRLYNDSQIVPYFCRTNIFKYSFFPRTISEWNALPNDIVLAESVSTFVDKLKLYL